MRKTNPPSTNVAVVSNKEKDPNEIDNWFTTDFVHDDDFCDFLHDDEIDSSIRSGVTTGTTTGTNSMVSSCSNSRANSRRGSFVYNGISMPCGNTLGHRKNETTTTQSPRKRARTPTR